MQPSKRLERLPPYLFAELERKVAEKRAAGVDVISLGIGDPDKPTPADVIAALATAAEDPEHAPVPVQPRAARAAGGARALLRPPLRRRASTPTPRSCPALGAKECVFNLNLAFLDPDSVALAADPGYPVYTGGPLLAGAEAVPMPLLPERGFAPDLDAIDGDVARRARLLYLNYPNNPTGRRRARRPVRARDRVRPRARRADRARRLLHRDDLRRLRRAVVPGGARARRRSASRSSRCRRAGT